MQTLESIQSNIFNLYNEYQNLDIKFDTFNDYANDYIRRLTDIFPNATVLYNIRTSLSVWKNFGFKIVLKYNNFLIYNINRVKFNDFDEYKKNIGVFKANYENTSKNYISQTCYNAISFDNKWFKSLYYHDSINDYINLEHEITIKEILNIYQTELDISQSIELQYLVDSKFPDNECIITFRGEDHKLYDCKDILELNSIVLNYFDLVKSR
jgi:hypothetical protein